MEVQAALGSDIALAFDECTPFHVERDYTRLDGADPPLARPLRRLAPRHAPPGQLLFGIVQGGVYEDLRAESTAYVAGSGVDGIAIGGSLGQEKEQMREVVGWSLAGLPEEPPRHLLGIGDVDDIVHAVGTASTPSTAPRPPGSPATGARSSRPGWPLAARPDEGAHRTSREPIDPDCPCPACRSTRAATCTTSGSTS